MQTLATSEKGKGTSAVAMNKNKRQPFFAPAFMQPKLTIGPVDDPYEREADAVAERVMRMPSNDVVNPFFSPIQTISPIQRHDAAVEAEEELQHKEEDEDEQVQLKQAKGFDVQRKCAACEEEENTIQRKEEDKYLQLKGVQCNSIQRKCAACEEEDKISRKESTLTPAPVATPSVHKVLNSPGHLMDKSTQLYMESRFGYDFGNVRIHNDEVAHRSSKDINALAYTHENHVVFGTGQYQPHTNPGKRLLAHELTHVVQQQGANHNIIRRAIPADPPPSMKPYFPPGSGTEIRGFETFIPNENVSHWLRYDTGAWARAILALRRSQMLVTRVIMKLFVII
jgi:hypothetical protein